MARRYQVGVQPTAEMPPACDHLDRDSPVGRGPVLGAGAMCAFLLALQVGASTVMQAERPLHTAATEAEITEARDLLFLTDDVSIPRYRGCDVISIFRLGTRSAFHNSTQVNSPGRMVGTSDLSLVLATTSNTGSQLAAVYRDRDSETGWSDTALETDVWVQVVGGIAITPDDQYVLIAVTRELRTGPSISCPRVDSESYFGVARFRIDEIDLERGTLGPEHGRVEFAGPAAEIIVADDGRIAHVVSVPYLSGSGLLEMPELLTIDIASMTEIAPRIPLESIGLVQNMCRGVFWPVGVTHATISPDERYVVTNRWMDNALNVVDLESRTAWSVDLEARRGTWTGGVSFSHGIQNHGRLAVHGVDHISVYDFGNGSDLVELDRVRIAPTLEEREGRLYGSNGDQGGPASPIEWTWNGEQVIAAISNRGSTEFRAWTVDETTGSMTVHSDYLACPVSWINLQIGIFTGNRTVPTVTASVTPTDTPTGTSSITPRPTSTPTRTPSSTPAPSSTPTSSSTLPPTATDVPKPAYLPIALTERCDPTRVRADVALVLDASSSMTGDKLEAAKAAAIAFIAAMRLPEDRVGVAVFNREAARVHALSGDADSLIAAIEGISVSPGTRIDRGLEAGLDVLADARKDEFVTPVLVLLTDGIQDAEPWRPAEIATEARKDGIVLHVVGLGVDVDSDFLRDVAGGPDRLHLSPGPAELAAIYTGIARSIPCPPAAFWGRR